MPYATVQYLSHRQGLQRKSRVGSERLLLNMLTTKSMDLQLGFLRVWLNPLAME